MQLNIVQFHLYFFPINKLEILLVLTFHFTICKTESQKERKTKSKQKVYWHSLPKFAVGYFSVFQFAAYPLVLERMGGVPLGLASWIVSPKTDMQQEYQKLIYKTITQVEGSNLLFTTLNHYIDSAVTWKLILAFLCLRKPFKCLKSRRCIKTDPANAIQR